MKRLYLLLLSFAFVFFACQEKMIEEFDNKKFGYEYFPLEVGKYMVYAVDSTIYDDLGNTIYNTSSQVKEEIVESYEDLTGDEIYRIERYWRANDSSDWKVTDVWTAYTTEGQAFRTEENLKFIKLVFPLLLGKEWNGNSYIDESTIITVSGESLRMFSGWDDYEVISIDEPETLHEIDYDQVATILLHDDNEENAIERRYALEKYAKGVGLIYKENIILDTQETSSSVPWEEKAEKGFILKQTLIEYN